MAECDNCTDCKDLTIPRGADGRGIVNITNENGTLTVIYTDGTSEVIGTFIGAPGDDGTDGVDGVDGVDGNRWHDGIITPSVVIGDDDDYYLDTVTGDVYHKVAGVWIVVGNIEGPPGPPGPAGGTGSIDHDDGVLYNTPGPNVIYDVGWSATSTDQSTTMLRVQFGDMNTFSATLRFNGTYAGSLSSDILIEFEGPLMTSALERNFTCLLVSGSNFYPARVWVDPVGATNYLRIQLPNGSLPTTFSTWEIKISGITLY